MSRDCIHNDPGSLYTARSINGESHREVSQVEEGELFTSFNGELHYF